MNIPHKCLKTIKDKIKVFVDHIYSLIPLSCLEIESYHRPSSLTNKKVCFFAAWDPDGIVDSYVLNYLDELVKENFDIYFSTTSPKKFSEETLSELKKRCIYISRRRNLGLDFVSWKLCYYQLPASHGYQELLLTNDSVFGPIFPLTEVFHKIDSMDEDVIGMTDNYERAHHLQSYFLFFKKKPLERFMPNFLKSIKILRDKDVIIEKYEVGLSKSLINAGFKLGSIFSVDCTLEKVKNLKIHPKYDEFKAGYAINSTTVFWHILIEHFRYPFLKREVLTKNVAPGTHTDNWQLFLSQYNQELAQTISKYLKRVNLISRK